MRRYLLGVLAVSGAAVLSAADAWTPPRYESGAVPAVPVLAVAGGQVLLQVTVTSQGTVGSVVPLRVTPPFTDALIEAVRSWRFRPAEETGRPAPSGTTTGPARRAVAAQVLVIGLFRPPSLNTPTLGEPPRDVAAASSAIPFPTSLDMPPYPPLARDDGMVLVEAEIGTDGRVARVQVLRPAPPFDSVAVDEIRRWPFRPARVDGVIIPTFAYVVVAFRQPVTGPQPPLTRPSASASSFLLRGRP